MSPSHQTPGQGKSGPQGGTSLHSCQSDQPPQQWLLAVSIPVGHQRASNQQCYVFDMIRSANTSITMCPGASNSLACQGGHNGEQLHGILQHHTCHNEWWQKTQQHMQHELDAEHTGYGQKMHFVNVNIVIIICTCKC